MVKWFYRLILSILLLVSIFVGVMFTIDNSTPVGLLFFGFQLPVLNVGLWLVIALLLGAVIGLLVSFIPLLFNKHSHFNKDRKISRLEKELDALRISALKAS